MITISPGDMVVAEVGQTKARSLRRLVKANEVTDNTVTGTYYDKSALMVAIVVPRDKVLANIGSSPAPGWVYGIGVTELSLVTQSDAGHKIIHRTKVTPEMEKRLNDTLAKYESVFKLLNFNIEVHPVHGNRLGFYGTRKRSTTNTDVMGVHVSAFDKRNPILLEEIMVHEAGHGVWNRLIPDDIRARMIKHYTDSVVIDPTELMVIRKTAAELDNFDGSCGTFLRRAKKEDRRLIRKMFGWIKEVHHVTWDDIDKLRSGGLTVASYFPTHRLITSTVLPTVTNYGTKNTAEFFCEAFALHHVGHKLPAEVKVTMKALDKYLEIN